MMKYRIRPYREMFNQSSGFFVQRKEQGMFKLWETVCVLHFNNEQVMRFKTEESAQAWIDKQKV